MLLDPSTRTVVPPGTSAGNGKEVGAAALATTGSIVPAAAIGFGVTANRARNIANEIVFFSLLLKVAIINIAEPFLFFVLILSSVQSRSFRITLLSEIFYSIFYLSLHYLLIANC
jgi:hypothetical protein